MQRFVLLSLCILTVACGARRGGWFYERLDDGTVEHFDANFESVYMAARRAITESQLAIEHIEELDRSHVLILGSKGSSFWSQGEYVRVYILAHEMNTEVRVVTKRAVSINITAKGDYSKDIFDGIRRNLDR